MNITAIADSQALNAATNAVNKAWDYSVSTGVLVGFCIFLGFIVLICLKIIIGDRKGDSIRQDKDTSSRIMLATAVQDLSTLMRSFKCLKD